MDEVFLGVMDLQEAKTHQAKLKSKGVKVNFKTNGATCTTGCKVTVEVWGAETDMTALQHYFSVDYLNNLKGHEPNLEALNSVYDPSAAEVLCQACGMKFSPTSSECPDCGLVYG
jgi:hypothetical protein